MSSAKSKVSSAEPKHDERGVHLQRVYRYLSIFFGIVSVISLGVAIYSFYKNEKLSKLNQELLERNREVTQEFKTYAAHMDSLEREIRSWFRDALGGIAAIRMNQETLMSRTGGAPNAAGAQGPNGGTSTFAAANRPMNKV